MAALPAAAGPLPDVDAFAASPAVRRALVRPDADATRPGSVVHMEARLGVPTYLQPLRAGDAGRRALAQKGLGAEGAARAHLRDLAPLWGLTEADVAAAPVRQVHDAGHGVIVVQLRQEAFGVPVFRDEMRIALDRAHEPVAFAGYIPSVTGLTEPVFALGAKDALARALADFGAEGLSASNVESLGPAPGGYERFALAGGPGGILADPARARKVLFHLPERLVPAWYLEVDVASAGTGSDLYAVVLSAEDGSLLYRHSLTASDSYAYRVWADASGLRMPHNGPQGRLGDPYPGSTPDRWQAPFVDPTLVSIESGPISTRDPWLPAGATETVGNNVDAYADVNAPDGFSSGDLRADVTAPGVFDRTFDVAKSPDASADQRKAAVTQLFYVTNFLHDWFYDAGFNEVAGNAQTWNYGRGGIGGDSLRAEAQDYSGTDNANMTTPADGGRPRMQMYVWTLGAARSVTITAPSSAARTLGAGNASFGPPVFSLAGSVVLADDGKEPRTDACEPLANGAAVAGKIALVDRGTCPFVVKIANAQAAGAIGVVVVNDGGDALLTMSDTAGATPLPYTIPSLFVGQKDGAALKALLPGLLVALTRERNRDGTVDGQLVTHEWAHMLTGRLVGDANGLSAHQAEGLGEGWSDFCALLLSVQPGDASLPGNARFAGIYPIGGYAIGGSSATGGPNEGWYFGIRRYPYSTDPAKDPLTYGHIVNGAALPPGAAVNAELFDSAVRGGADNAEAHNTGEVWATMLWECYAALLNDTPRLTFEQARDRMRAYLVASLKLTPVNPTLLEARDALLTAVFVADREDHALFVRAFAKRGAGPRAVASPDRFTSTNAGAVESFDVGGDLEVVSVSLDDSAAPCDRDGRLDAGETGLLRLTLKNRGLARLAGTQLAVTSSNPAVSFPGGATASVATTDPTQSVSVSVPVALAAGVPGIQSLGLTLTLRDPALISDETSTPVFRGNADDLPGSSASDDMESALSPWGAAAAAGLDASASFRRIEVTAFDHRWSSRAASNAADVTLTSPPLAVSATAPFGFTFRHRYSMVVFTGASTPLYVDGGVVEISTDDGATWTDVGASAAPGYSQSLYDGSDAQSPLHGRRAWAGDAPGLPGFVSVQVSLGAAYAGKTVRVRFRRAAELLDSRNYWEIDDVAFTGVTNTPFPSLAPDRGRCRGRTLPVGTPAPGPAGVRAR